MGVWAFTSLTRHTHIHDIHARIAHSVCVSVSHVASPTTHTITRIQQQPPPPQHQQPQQPHLKKQPQAYIQLALLFTSNTGQRTVRVHNLQLHTAAAVRACVLFFFPPSSFSHHHHALLNFIWLRLGRVCGHHPMPCLLYLPWLYMHIYVYIYTCRLADDVKRTNQQTNKQTITSNHHHHTHKIQPPPPPWRKKAIQQPPTRTTTTCTC